MEHLNVYCIIVTYNGLKWIDKCLGSLRKSSLLVHPVVIDNCSNDETVSYIKQNYPEVHVIINKENKGFGQANNQGIEYAYKQGGSHFFLLNQDAWVHENTIVNLVDVQNKHNLFISSPIHLNGQGNQLDYNYFSYTILDESNIEFVSDLIVDEVKEFYAVSKINAAAWMLSRRTIDVIGGFDPIFFHYGEDSNYCQRVKYHKGVIGFVPNALIHHDREKKGNIKVFKKNSVSSMLLSQYSDVNKNIWDLDKTRIKIHFANLKLGLSLLIGLKFKDFVSLLNSYIVFIKKLQRLVRNKKTNVNIGRNWLNLD